MEQNVEVLKSWDGFISQEGKFYKHLKWMEDKTPDDFFIEAFAHDKLLLDVSKKLKELRINKDIFRMSYDDLLVDLLGFIAYRKKGDKVEIMYPDYKKSEYDITKKQLETLEAVVNINEIYDIDEQFYKENKKERVRY